MKLKKTFQQLTTLLALILTLVACSSKPEVKEFPSSANAKQEITNLQIAFDNSKESGYDLLAPNSYKEARYYLQEARTTLKKDGNNERVLKEVALGNAYLEQAKKNTEANKAKLQDVLAARQSAINANARDFYPQTLAKLDDDIREETTKLEKGKKDQIKEKRSDFIAGYSDLELASIKKYHLGESKFLIDDAVKKGARDLAPKTLAKTNKSYKEVDSFISQNRYNTSQIEILAAGVLAEARELEATTATARGLTSATPEETAIRMREEQKRLNLAQDELIEEKGEAQALAAKNAEMSEEQRLNAVYDEARSKFTPQEAEVYKQGNNLVIRLRSLEFPKSQAVLKGEDFALLKKVEEVIASFDKSRIIVEGHTDSTGAQRLNQELSEKRADAVKQYLEVNTPETVSEIEAKGYGYEKPLATNKTEAGRAQNRRVDVIIEPVQI